jgi:arsenite/tail-anchored protein-transporting ATPase
VPVAGRRALYAAEVDASRALDRWLARRRSVLERVALRGTWFDEEDITRLLRLSLPGIDEIAALLELARLGQSGRYDLIVVDTAPTGHTLRMLEMPDTLSAVAGLFDRMQAKHRVMVQALRGSWKPESDDLVIEAMANDARGLAALLRDRARVEMTWVSLAEPMAVEETVDAWEALASLGVPLTDVIVNRLTPPPPERCVWCGARRAFEAVAIAELRRRLRAGPAFPVVRTLLSRDAEPTGVRALASIGSELAAEFTAGTFLRKVPAVKGRRPQLSAAISAVIALDGVQVTAGSRPKPVKKVPAVIPRKVPAPVLVMFGGKGGVGKTTCAAAAGIVAATERPERRVLLISTDPAHSLADALGVRLDDTPRRLPRAPRNLLARELDAAAGFARVRDRYRTAIDALFDRFSRNSALDAGQDRRVMRDLIDLAPPGIDELAAVIEVIDALDSGSTDLVILDTAPSGHALRLLEMPAMVQEWVRALMAILLKYQPVVGVGELGAILVNLSRGLGRLRAVLTDAQKTHFVIVTRAAALPRAESVRLLKRLTRLRIHVPTIIVNAVGAGTCSRCRIYRRREALEMARLHKDLGSASQRPDVVEAPGWMPPPQGREALARWWHSRRTRR